MAARILIRKFVDLPCFLTHPSLFANMIVLAVVAAPFTCSMLRFQTTGESHGQALVAILSGLPAGLPIDFGYVNRELKRRMVAMGAAGA